MKRLLAWLRRHDLAVLSDEQAAANLRPQIKLDIEPRR